MEPVGRGSGVGGCDDACAVDGDAAQQLGPEVLGDQCEFVDVGTGEGDASDAAFGERVGCADEVHVASEEAAFVGSP